MLCPYHLIAYIDKLWNKVIFMQKKRDIYGITTYISRGNYSIKNKISVQASKRAYSRYHR